MRHPDIKVAATDFCWDGGMVNSLATAASRLVAGVAYRGKGPAPDKAPNIKASMAKHCAPLDQRVNARL